MRATRQLYDSLSDIWHKVHSTQKGSLRKKQIDEFWNQNKGNSDTVQKKVEELNRIYKRRQLSVYDYFKGTPKVVETRKDHVAAETPTETSSTNQHNHLSDSDQDDDVVPVKNKKRESIAQDQCRANICKLSTRIDALKNAKSSGIATQEQIDELKKLRIQRNDEIKKLRSLKKNQIRQNKFRSNKKNKILQLKEKEPETYEKFVNILGEPFGTRGQPRLEVDQPLLLETIIKLVSPTAAAEERRRSEIFRTCKTLDDLHDALLAQGFKLSRSSLYLRLLPRRIDSREGQRHINTVPVKLIKATNDARGSHMDSHFCASTVKYLKQLAELLGEKSVFVLSQDDKARVPLGITAAVKQAPILMHLEYRVRLQDHDFFKGTSHKLIPSVYAGLAFNANKILGYSGPTYVAIRSGKHDKSSAESHATDFRKLISLQNFNGIACHDGIVKPVVIIFTDGGPDENPRYEGTLVSMISHFKEFNLDALFVTCYAPGQSAYNPVERRMAPLSKDLAGVILPHDYYGTHLQGTKTVDRELEMQNFNKAGECLAEIWNGTLLDGYAVHSEYVAPNVEVPPRSTKPTEQWIFQHVRQSQYCLQIIKCNDTYCCPSPKTNIKLILQNGFLPAPIAFTQESSGLIACDQNDSDSGSFLDLTSCLAFRHIHPMHGTMPVLPFDYYCPSLRNKLQERICPICRIYFSSKKTMFSHKKIVHKSTPQSIDDTIESVIRQSVQTTDDEAEEDIEVIRDIWEWIRCPFIDINSE